MKFLIVLATVTVCCLAKPPLSYYEPGEHERKQNEAARYQFSSDIDDQISDLTHQRTEEREGLAVKGMYSYSDGFVRRTVHYEADDKGYRVIGTDEEPLGGPEVDLSGTASVAAAAHGQQFSYKVKSIPVDGPVSKLVGDYETVADFS